jgi:WD40 repeat protein
MKLAKICLLLFIPVFAFGQAKSPDCKCAASIYAARKADTVFQLPGNVSIASCGSEEKNIIKGKVLFSEFVLSVCGSDKIIKFWDAVTICNVKTLKGALLVETLVNLPVGSNMKYKETVWTTERIYFSKGKLVRDSVINPHLPKYTASQVNYVLSRYKHTPNANNDVTIELADKLFISIVSGSPKAKEYLVNFRKKFTTLDGVYQEDYDSLMRMLQLWERSMVPPAGNL